MRDIYLIDFENVASEGLSGITYLSEEDQVIIFYSNNSNRLTMKMHILIGKSICNLNYFEVTVGGKNALDHQISTYLGYLMGTNAAERNYYIVSRDMGYKHVANFWASQKIGPRVRCIDSIKGASRLERNRRETVLQSLPQEPQPEAPVLEPQPVPAAPVLPEQVDAPAADLAAESLPVDEPVAEAVAEPAVIEPIQEPTEDAATETESPEEAPLETSEPEPERSAEPETTESAEPKPEPQCRLNRNRPRPRGRYRRNSNTAETKVAAAESPSPVAPLPEPQEPKPAQKETAEHTEESAEKKAATRKRPGTKKQETVNLDQLSSLIAPYPKLQENVLRDLIANNKRQVLCNTLRKHLGQEKGLALYNEIKKSAWH